MNELTDAAFLHEDQARTHFDLMPDDDIAVAMILPISVSIDHTAEPLKSG